MSATSRRARSVCLTALVLALVNGFISLPVSANEPSKAKTDASSKPFADDPVHQAGLKASSNHKLVFVLGEGFDEDIPLIVLRDDLAKLGLVEHMHYEFLRGAKSPRESGMIYVGGEVIRMQPNNQPLIFSQDATEDAVAAIRNLISRGYITVARP